MFSHLTKRRKGGDLACIFVHAGAGFHSHQNEPVHLSACHDAARAGMAVMRAGGSAVDAVEIVIKVLEDREITNAGYGSNLTLDGVVECDAVIVDHLGRSGATGAVSQIRNPISLARLLLDHTSRTLSLSRVPPNLLVGQGAADFAHEHGMAILPHDILVSSFAKERWVRWNADLFRAEMQKRHAADEVEPTMPTTTQNHPALTIQEQFESETVRKVHTKAMMAATWNEGQAISPPPSDREPPFAPPANPSFNNSSHSLPGLAAEGVPDPPEGCIDPTGPPDFIEDAACQASELLTHPFAQFRFSDEPDIEKSPSGGVMLPTPSPQHPGVPVGGGCDGFQQAQGREHSNRTPTPNPRTAGKTRDRREDFITDTVGAIAIDMAGNIACGASSGGIGMKHRGRIGPAALVGVGAAVVPADDADADGTTVATVTSGTGEHMATTFAANVCNQRIYHNNRKIPGGGFQECDDDEAIRSFITQDFMGHPSVKNSKSTGAIGMLTVKKTNNGVYLYFGHNTDSFAMASMHSGEVKPVCTISRSKGNGIVAQGGRVVRYRKKKTSP